MRIIDLHVHAGPSVMPRAVDAAEMLQDINEFKQNPSIRFEYKYFVDDTPTRFVEAITNIKGELEKEEDEKKNPSMLPILAGVAAAFVLVALLIVGIVLVKTGVIKFGGNDSSSYSDTMVVPNFINKEYRLLTPEDIEGFAGTPTLNYAYSNEVQEGYIIAQDPAPNKNIKRNTKSLTLTISRGPLKIELPEVMGQKEETMVNLLETKGLRTKVIQATDESVPEGYVIRLKAASEPIVKDTLIYVYVSIGAKQAEPIEIDNVVGMTKTAAMARLTQQGFVVSEDSVQLVNVDGGTAGTVVEQIPVAGEKLLPGEEVQLKICSGYKNVDVIVPLPESDGAIDLQV